MTTTADKLRAQTNDLWRTYDKVHGLTKPTNEEAERGVRKLYRYATGKTWHGKVVIYGGKRGRTWLDGDVLRVAPEQGWQGMVHDLAWSCLTLTINDGRSAAFKGALPRLELRMAKQVIVRGWFVGTLKTEIVVKPKPTKDEVRERKIARLEARMSAWEKKLSRAQVAIKKINRSLNAYRRVK